MIRSNRRTLATGIAAALLSLSAADAAFAGHADTAAVHERGLYDQFIVRFKEGTAERGNAAARKRLLDATGKGNGVGIAQLRRLGVGADVIRTDRKLGGPSARLLIERLAADPSVEYVELDGLNQAAMTPNDTYYADHQWHYFETAGGANLPPAWEKSIGTGVVVAVLDTGVTSHPDLDANLVAGYDFISDASKTHDNTGRDSDASDPGNYNNSTECDTPEQDVPAQNSSWHGTHTAGTVAAVTNNGAYMAGVAPGAKVQPLRVLGTCGGQDSDIADAIVWAAGGTVPNMAGNPTRAKVINLSLGRKNPSCPTTLQDAINTATGLGTVVVVAAGNAAIDASGFTPANCQNVVTVAAVAREGNLASYSDFGNFVDVSAPGGGKSIDGLTTSYVWSLFNTGTQGPGSPTYAGMTGTSMAAPHVAGIVALMQSRQSMTPDQVEFNLKASSRPFPVACSRGDLACGWGIVNANAALDSLAPDLTISDASIVEGDAGTKTLTFTASISWSPSMPVGFSVTTANGTAIAGSDYVALNSAAYSFATGQTTKTFTVTLNGDAQVEGDETFVVNVHNVIGAIARVNQVTGTILNDDAVLLSIGNTTVTEGDTGTRTATFPVTLSDTSTHSVDFVVSTANGTAIAGSDYTALGQAAFSIPAGQLGTTVEVPVTGDTAIEPSETFVLNAVSATNATIAGAQGTATIANDDVPVLSIGDVTVTEGNSYTTPAKFTISLSEPALWPVIVNVYTTGAGTATANLDYAAVPTTQVTIPAGVTSQDFTLLVHGDNDIEPNEWLTLRLANPSGAVLEADPRGFGYIYNDDLVRLSIGDASVIEGNSGSKTMTFVASLTAPSPDPVTFSMYTGSANGTANQNGDTDFVPETAANNPMQIPAGQLAATFAVTVNGDTKDEGNEVFSVNTTQPVGAVLLDPQGIGTILNDDSATLSISDATPVVEGNSGTKVANFTVTLSAAVDHDVTFSLATQANTASNPADYTPVAPTPFTIPQGQTSLTFPVTIKGDTTVESTETFFVNLTAASGATVRDGQGVGTINTDEWPSLSISNASVAEGDSGTTTMSFTVTLSQAVNAPVTYNLTSANGTAVAGSDFVGVPTIAQTLPAGQTVRAFLVTINGDTAAEAGEQFTLTLGVNPGAGATVAYGTGTGTILNDD